MVDVRYPMSQKIDLTRAAEELTAYAAKRLVPVQEQGLETDEGPAPREFQIL